MDLYNVQKDYNPKRLFLVLYNILTALYLFSIQILTLISPMTDRPAQIENQIEKIEVTMKQLKLYASIRPDDSAFESSTPFCYDTMSFLEWMQWVMFPKTRDLISRDLPLPTVCEIHPLAEEEFKLLAQDTGTLLDEIQQLDRLFNIRH